MTLTVGSLCTGIGGIDLGLERAGMRVVWQSEIDPFCCAVLARHWPGVPNLGDMRDIDWTGVPAVDLVAAGFPCQPVSIAGRRRAQEDERWLWPEVARALRHLGPRWALLENVPALLSLASGRAAQEVFGDLAELGFDAEWFVLSAAEIGAPHLRRRVFIVAHAERQQLRDQPGRGSGTGGAGAAEPRDHGQNGPVAHPVGPAGNGSGPAGQEVLEPRAEQRPGRRGGSLGEFWAVEPGMGRVAHGVPARLDRLRALGNAVVPQVAQLVGEWILAGGRQRLVIR